MRYLLAVVLALASFTAHADTNPKVVESMGEFGAIYTMCDAQTATGDCLDVKGDEIVLQAGAFKFLTFYSKQSTASTYTCDVMSNEIGHDAASGTGDDLTATAITEAAETTTLEGVFGYIWVTCSAINADGNVTISVVAQQ